MIILLSLEKSVKVTLAQFATLEDKDKNIRKAIAMIEDASKLGADIVILPVAIYHLYTNIDV